MINNRDLATALMGLGIIPPFDRHQLVADMGPLAECPLRQDDQPDGAVLAIGACAALNHVGFPTIIVFMVAKCAVIRATTAQIAEVAARQAAIPPGYDS